MADITMCLNEKCPLREKCYRWTAKPSHWQSVGLFKNNSKSECEFYIESK